MILEIWVEAISLDLYSKSGLKQTLQVNDIAEIKDRQASFTNSFDIPKTAKNKRAFDGLSISSDTSRIPYTKPNCRLKLEGFDFLTAGWINVSETDENYKVHLYSGLINFFKAIENISLGELDLSEIEHTKNLASVIASFSNPNYRYLITDYNGLTHYGTDGTILNIDYLVPSVSVQYLWNKIHSTFLYNYNGAIFDTDDFKNLWLTYPKYIAVDEVEEMVEASGSRTVETFNSNGNEDRYYRPLVLTPLTDNIYFEALETAQYKIKLTVNNAFEFPLVASLKYFYSINEESVPFINRTTSTLMLEKPASTDTGEVEIILLLNQGDKISFFDYLKMNGFLRWQSSFSVKVEKVIPGTASFTDALKDFSIPDFIKEIFNLFGLTAFTSEFIDKTLDYRSFKERVETSNVKNWTDKYIERSSEKYTYNNYAQRNIFSYKYNDKEASFNDGSLNINNINLTAKSSAFSSKTYSPERTLSEFFTGSAGNKFLKVFKFYDKTIKEAPAGNTIEYKGLDKRFHFARAEQIISTVQIGSKTLLEQQTISSYYLATFKGLDWITVLNTNYRQFGRILNDSRIHNIQLNLSLMDFIDFDFNTLFYFGQEQQYYIANKIEIDYNSGKASGEFIRLKKEKDDANIDPGGETIELKIRIAWGDNSTVIKEGTAATEVVKIVSLDFPTDDEIVDFEWYRWSTITNDWYGLGSGVTPYTVSLSEGVQKFRMKGITEQLHEVISNELQYTGVVYICYQYTISAQIGSGNDFTVSYIDCMGNTQFVTAVGDRGNNTQTFCAARGSVTEISGSNGQIYEDGPCE